MMTLQEELKNLELEQFEREAARRHFVDFNRYIYPEYQENWHTQLICDALEHVLAGHIRFLIIEAPPRHSKSIHVSQLFPAYAMGKEPDEDIIISSYSGDLAVDHGRETRNIIDAAPYQNLFDTRLSEDSKAKGKWNTNSGGAYNAVGVGGSTTGKGAKYFVVDDPFKDRKEADSEVIRSARWAWLRTVARTRLTPDGAMIIMHTRWHEDDIIGKLTEGDDAEPWTTYEDFLQKGYAEKWVRLTLKAIATEDERYRKEGEVLWPQRYPMEEIRDIEKSLGPYEFSALYQQEPVDDAAREFKQEWIKYRTWDEVQKMHTRKFTTIDPAPTTTDGADYTGVTRNYVNEKNEWNIKSKRYRLSSKEMIPFIFALHEEGMEQIGIEEGIYTHMVKPFLEDEMKKRNKWPRIIMLKHKGTMKETRIRGLIPFYANKRIFHIQGECTDLEGEMAKFPKSKNDDCIDSLAYQTQIADAPFKGSNFKQPDFEPSMSGTAPVGPTPPVYQGPQSPWDSKRQSYAQPDFESSMPITLT